jgi:hypothetical protein
MWVLALVLVCSPVAAVYCAVTGNWVAACFFLLLLSVVVVSLFLADIAKDLAALSARVTGITENLLKIEIVAQENGTSWRFVPVTKFEVGHRVRVLNGDVGVVSEVRRDGAGSPPLYTVTFSGGRYCFARDPEVQEC